MTSLTDLAILLHPDDSVAIAKADIQPDIRFIYRPAGESEKEIITRERIPSGHKVAVRGIARGSVVLRYGQVIGFATQEILPGEWVHTHNLEMGNPVRDTRSQVVEAWTPAASNRTFMGYLRPGGRVGTRNKIAVLSTVTCSASVVQKIAHYFTPERLAPYPNVDGVIAVTHHTGCCTPVAEELADNLRRTLENTARNPNVAGFIFVGLGCEENQLDLYRKFEADPFFNRYLQIQDVGGSQKTVEAGIRAVEEMLPEVNKFTRTESPASALALALQCGGSDGWSGITANPLLGYVSDRLVAAGGTSVLAETPEIFGAEHLLTSRVASPEIAEKLIRIIERWQKKARLLGFSMDNNPTPGNKAGGLTTILEKSLGAVTKGGGSPLMGVYEYSQIVDRKGFVFMDTPGFDTYSLAGQVAGGCNLAIFTTGRGAVYGGAIVPTIKVSSTSALYRRMQDDMDFNAGVVLESTPMEQAAGELFELALAAASGTRTKSEAIGPHEVEFTPWVFEAVL